MTASPEIVVLVDDSPESKNVRQFIEENLSSHYGIEYCSASGPFVPSAHFRGPGSTLIFGSMLWKFLTDLKNVAEKKEKQQTP